jgi:hypothetical protein
MVSNRLARYGLFLIETRFFQRGRDHSLPGRLTQDRRKRRSGAFGEGRHCTMIEPGEHLWKCMVYIELNMVRAGVVRHPEQGTWCSYQEWMGRRCRYVLTGKKACLGWLGNHDFSSFQEHHRRLIDETKRTEANSGGFRRVLDMLSPGIVKLARN